VFVLTPAVSAADPDAGDRYEIELSREAFIGQRARVQGEATQERTISTVTDDAEPGIEKRIMEIRLDVEREVRAVDGRGTITEAAYTVTECIMTRSGQVIEVAPAGSVILGRRTDDGFVFTIDDEPIDGAAADAIALIVGVDIDDVSDSDAFGTAQPRRVGDSWDVNAGRVAHDLRRRSGQPVLKGDVSGEAALVEVQDHDGRPCLVINTHLAVRNVIPDLESYPSDLRIRDASMSAMFQGIFPTDATLPPAGEAISMNSHAVLAGPMGAEGSEGELHVSTKRTVRRATTLISSAGSLTVVDEND
jgi:hypothetical protein